MNEPLLIFGMMVVTFGVRYPALAVVGRMQLPEPVVRALKYVPVAVLTAIVFPAALMPDGQVLLSLNNAYLIGAIVAVVISWRTKSLLWTIGISMAVFLLWHGLVG
jgi:branched-subunit amino acid transport protein